MICRSIPKHLLCLAAKRLIGSAFFLIIVVTGLAAQTTSTTDGTTPSGIAPGSASGSYALSGLDNVNFYNGNLNFALPLLQIGGRGSAGYEMTLSLNTKSWRVEKIYDQINDAYKFRPNQNWWSIAAGLSPGMVAGRQMGVDYAPNACYGVGGNYPIYPTKGMTTLTFAAPGGTEDELRDVNTNGQPLSPANCSTGASRGTVFSSTDGSSMTFVSDAPIIDQVVKVAQTIYPTGYLLLRNGTRYRIISGKVMWIRDRNGSQVTFAYDTNNRLSTITDSLSRQITLTYGGSDPAYYTDISYRGFGGLQRTIRVNSTTLSNALRPGYAIQTYGQLFPELYSSYPIDASISLTNNPYVVSSVTLPNNRQYQFSYNSYGEVARVIFPAGGAVEYDMVPGSGVFYYAPRDDKEIYRRVAERRVYPDGGSGSTFESRTTFVASTNNPFDPKPWYTDVTVDQLSQNGTLLAREKHYFTGSGLASLFKFFTNVPSIEFYSPWIDGKEYQTEALDTGGNVLRRITNVWQQRAPVSWWTGQANYAPANDPRLTQIVSTLVDTNQVAQQTFVYDQYNNRTDTYEYDYGSGAIGPLLRHTHTDYLTATNYTNALTGAHLRSLPTASRVYAVNPANGVETLAAQSTIAYDEPTYPILAYGSVTGWVDPGTAARGNVTTSGKWLNTTGAYLQTHAQYDQAGNLRNAWDAKGNQSQLEYSSVYAYAFPTLTRTAVPDPSGASGSTASLVATSIYDFDTGLVTSTTDANGQTTSFEHTDLLDRLTRVNFPDGGRMTYIYVDAHQCGPYVETRTLLDSTGREADSYQFFDGLGRPYRAFTYENQDTNNPYLTVDTQYDALGRAWRGSNPYRSAGCTSTINPSGRWTQTTFDALSRPTQVTTADNAVVTNAYSGNTVTVTDQAGKKRRTVTDALGRLARVDEPDSNGNLGLASAPAQPTTYTYDALGNLRKVDQGGQQRFFMYDSLSRLLRAKNPEQTANSAIATTDSITGNSQWSMGYAYDNNGNLTTRIDARNASTTYAYDALNRNTSVTYSDGTTPAVYRYYDSATNGRGRLYWDQAVGVSANVFDAYDAVGRPTQYHQRFWVNGAWGNYFSIARTYDKAGHVLTQTSPSGRTVNYGYDIAGRINSDTGNLGDGVTRTYATGMTYSEFGGLQQEQFGTQTPLYHKLHYNVRGQLYDVRLSTVAWATDQWNWNRGAIVDYYATADLTCQTQGCRANSGPDNNANVRQSQYWIPANEAMTIYNWTEDRYAYDSLNRLKSVTEFPGTQAGLGAQSFIQTYDYDRWGNRTINQSQTSTNVPHPNYTADTNTNRLIAPAGYTYSYDSAGNQTSDNYTGQGVRTYDAENRMKQAQGSPNGQWQTYTYDADGRRIKRNVNGVETWQVYGLDGELLAEYQSGAAPYLPVTEYGYRGGELLTRISSGDTQRLSRFVTNLYYGALQRDPTPSELQDKSNQLAAAGVVSQSQLLATASYIARSLFTSTNYETSPYRSDTQYVTDLYYAYLQRGPDASGLNWWVVQAGQPNGRANVCNAFEASSEFQTLVATLYGTSTSDNERTEHFVNNFYLGAYGRNATATELQQQRDSLNAAAAQGQIQVQAQAETFGRSLFAGQVNDASLSNTQYVTNLYEAFLQRGPDSGGLSFWSGQASVGQGRQNVLGAFATCGAFRELAGTLYREANWLVADQLGTPRMIVNKSGSLSSVKRHDYLPFGEELYAGTGGRTTTQGYVGDSVRQKFTSQERDNETGLDYMHARYFASAQGRFNSADTFAGSNSNPQTLNLYAYVQNNPLTFSDPTGHIADDHGLFGALNDPWSEIPWTGAGQQQQSPAWVPYVGNGIVDLGETPADEGYSETDQPLKFVTVLSNNVDIKYDRRVSAIDRLAASRLVSQSAGLINANAAKLTDPEKKAIGEIRTFSVVGPGVFVGVAGHTFSLDMISINASSAAYLASLFGHEGQHLLNTGKYSGANLWQNEQSAGTTQLGIGRTLGFTSAEIRGLEQWIDPSNRDNMQKHMLKGRKSQ